LLGGHRPGCVAKLKKVFAKYEQSLKLLKWQRPPQLAASAILSLPAI
jgi:hypothetical protein